jgi:alkanesulfonate monooxygenase SsuD/methylene tetrahydromethanopterin reductase-like flavin-dependent oxidoreductase (luciferase family)
VIEHAGAHFPFEPVAFEPKPVQAAGPPIMVGGESAAALRRAAERGDGWFGMRHTPLSAAPIVERLRELRASAGRTGPFDITVIGEVRDGRDLESWAVAGVDRVVVTPWRRSREALPAMASLADAAGLG